MSEIQEPNTHETLYETQNQNIDTHVANEEAPVSAPRSRARLKRQNPPLRRRG